MRTHKRRDEESDRKNEQQRGCWTACSTQRSIKRFSERREKETGNRVAQVPDDDEVEGMRVDFYLVVFLKFIASIEVDSTTFSV